MTVELHLVDCLDFMRTMPDKSVDAVITDPPYGITRNQWDDVTAVNLPEYHRLSSRCLLFSFQPFASKLVYESGEWFKYELIWHKTQAVGHLNAYVQPLREHENILVFGNGIYNPQLAKKDWRDIRPFTGRKLTSNYGEFDTDAPRTIATDMSFPRTVIKFANVNRDEKVNHPTQKPIKLLVYLINTYSNPGATIFDPFMGSGTTGVACVQTGRNFIGCEIDPGYFAIAEKRIKDAQQQMRLGI